MMYYEGRRFQRGHGLGGLFRTIMRVAMPVIKRTAVPLLKRAGKSALKAAGKEMLKTGADFAGDLMQGKSLKSSAKARGKQGLQNVLNSTRRAVLGAVDSVPGKRATKRKHRTKAASGKTHKLMYRDIFS